jgi:hypothetical protein
MSDAYGTWIISPGQNAKSHGTDEPEAQARRYDSPSDW